MMAVVPELLPAATNAEDLAASALAIAKRFASGATMWCFSPCWRSHGRHVAVEFVHPVIVGKRALPTICVNPEGAPETLRLLARPGDILVAVAPGDDTDTRALLRRAEAWGLYRLWLGAGPRPSPGVADHTVWLEEVNPALAAHSGDVVMLYHLLWELTHVALEHPGLLVESDSASCEGEMCITCSDEGRIAEVRRLVEPGTAEALASGRLERIDVSLIDAPDPGDLVLVHAGVALCLVDPVRE